MDRLTERRPNGVVRSNVMGDSVMLRLAAYEDTGLMPEQVAGLQADRDAWKRRAEAAVKDLNELRKKTGWKCAYCEYDTNYVREACAGCGYNNDNNWVWRGPRDGGKEVAP